MAAEKNFTRAAAKLFVAQSAVSYQIVKLEKELGIELLLRSSRGVALTATGELVLARARRVLNEVDAIKSDVAQVHGLVRGRVGLGGMVTLGPLDIAELLGSFHRRHPGVDIRLVVATTRELQNLLLRDELDLAVAPELPGGALPGISGRRLFDEELVVVMPPDHTAAASSRALVTSALEPHPFIGFYPGSATREAIDRRLTADGVVVRVAFESAAADVVRRLVSHGLGLAILPRSTVGEPGPPVVVRSLRPKLICAILLAWRTDRPRSPAAQALLAHVLETAEQHRIALK